ncbi:kelch domain-containing protein 9 isoform X1 [Pipistrellus kuhlii]|uniref:Kelch domain-containing protein 9 n=1 Tax=Pipistrellus kuhlii TaxID=59472 RepID=A0A7J7QXI8_PIPKU|nr:kelch domain-containing protein 9 isoform X1 [Pipistrellus kuhlii]XP_045436311.1 kelch domain-containing protein 9 isoform X1 [Pipistrellus kuhlii]KAF6268487.1 kelch domain containing 9 [Pipistrellus kuhlii]
MAAAPPGGAGGSRWTWRPVARDALLARAFHSCTELRGRLYLVGGLLAGGAAEPSADTVVLDPAGPAVRTGARGGPRRSHHDAAALGGRWLCAVGGWDGARRLAAVAALDAERGEWEAWAAAPGSCAPAGLSSHTCTRLSDRELRVAGREGGTRTQRRYGSIYTLRLDPGARTYRYREESYRSASRSGHCAALLPTPGPRPGHQLLLFGGCDSAEPEVAGHWRHGEIREEAPAAPLLTEQLSKLVSSGQGSRHGPRGLRHHSCSVVGPFAVLFGGETLTRARDTICNDLYIYDARRAPSLWFRFPCADRALKRVGHRTCLWNDQLYLVGGFGEDGRTASPQLCTLDLFL